MVKRLIFDAPNRLRELRQAQNRTLKDVATAMGTTLAQLQRLETGERDLDVPWMLRAAAALGCQPADLLLPEHGGLSDRERGLVDTVREVPAPSRAAIYGVAESVQPYRGEPQVHELSDRLLPPRQA